jgi:hypothetical protein
MLKIPLKNNGETYTYAYVPIGNFVYSDFNEFIDVTGEEVIRICERENSFPESEKEFDFGYRLPDGCVIRRVR